MDSEQALAVLSQALKLEREGRAFYLQAAKATVDAKGKEVFASLAADEQKHAEMILRQLDAVEGNGAFVPLPDVNVIPIDANARIFPLSAKEIRSKVGVDSNALEAIQVALENEVRSYDLYREASQETDDLVAKALYTWLVQAEHTHFELLMSNWQSLSGMGGWV